MTALTRARDAVERRLLTTVLGLPEGLQRRLAGKPVELDGDTLATDLQLMLRRKKAARLPAVETLPIDKARAATRHEAAQAGGDQPIGEVRFVGDIDTHDAPCRLIAERAGVRVLSVEYHQGPEHPFPAAHDDAERAYHWVVDHARELGADPERIGVGGDSAGGNLAAATAIHAARTGLPCRLQLLVYPMTDARHGARDGGEEFLSMRLFDEGFFLSRVFMDRATECYVADDAQMDDPRFSVMLADLPEGLAPAYLCTAGFDPLRDEGEAYADLLEKAGVTVTRRRFDGLIHSFFNVVGAGRSGPAAVAEIADAVRAGLH